MSRLVEFRYQSILARVCRARESAAAG